MTVESVPFGRSQAYQLCVSARQGDQVQYERRAETFVDCIHYYTDPCLFPIWVGQFDELPDLE